MCLPGVSQFGEVLFFAIRMGHVLFIPRGPNSDGSYFCQSRGVSAQRCPVFRLFRWVPIRRGPVFRQSKEVPSQRGPVFFSFRFCLFSAALNGEKFFSIETSSTLKLRQTNRNTHTFFEIIFIQIGETLFFDSYKLFSYE